MILKVARLGHPAVRTAARPVPAERIRTAEFQKLIDDMIETMREYEGVGLAAPQVHLSIQLAVLECEHNPRYPDQPAIPLAVVVNPIVTVIDRAPVEDWEGCLSIPDLRGSVPRFLSVRVQALDRNAAPLDFVATDFHARVVQHETDHLKGEVYLDRMPDLRTLSHLAEFRRFKVAPIDH